MSAGRRTPIEPASLVAVLCLVVILVAVGVITTAATRDSWSGKRRTIGYGQVRFDGAGPERWAQRWRQEQRQLTDLRTRVRHLEGVLHAQRRILLRKPQVVEAINLACATYGYCSTLWRKARCETGGTFSPHAYNSTSEATGLFQFLPSTWRSTPFARLSPWSPYPNAMAAAWMHAHGRGGEWACQ